MVQTDSPDTDSWPCISPPESAAIRKLPSWVQSHAMGYSAVVADHCSLIEPVDRIMALSGMIQSQQPNYPRPDFSQ